MHYLNVLSTAQAPVSANGPVIENRHGKWIAQCGNSFMATALADLINKGIPTAQAEAKAYADNRAAIERLFGDNL